MARIRSIKPDFWSSEDTFSLSIPARLLWIALWNFADDLGRGSANLRQVKAEVFPADDEMTSTAVGNLLSELEKNGNILLYEVDGKPYYEVPSFLKHQAINHPTPPKYPSPNQYSGSIPVSNPESNRNAPVPEPDCSGSIPVSNPGEGRKELGRREGSREKQEPTPTFSDAESDQTIGAIPSPSGRREAASIQARIAAESHDGGRELDAVIERLNAAQLKKLEVPGSINPTDHRDRKAALTGLNWAKKVNPKDPGLVFAQAWITYLKDRDEQKKPAPFSWFISEISQYYRKFKKQTSEN